MAERPTTVELVEAVREFLERDVMSAVEGRVAFHTRVAVNVLGVVERELRLGTDHAAAEQARLVALLGHDGDRDDLRRELAAAIRSGDLDDRRAEVLEALQATAADGLAVANPKYIGDPTADRSTASEDS
jgi:Domain of unknown function (DUF6285)